MHPLRKLREAGAPTLEQVNAILDENVVFNSPVLVKPIRGREAVGKVITSTSANRGDDVGEYLLEAKVDENTTFLRWKGTINGRKFESLEILVDGPDGKLVERTIAYRPYPSLKIFRDRMYAIFGSVIPADMWEEAAS